MVIYGEKNKGEDNVDILFINADCLSRNSSANLCHLAYIRGLLEAGHQVTVISADGPGYSAVKDQEMKLPTEVESYTVDGMSLYEKLSVMKNRRRVTTRASKKEIQVLTPSKKQGRQGLGIKLKRIVLSMYGIHGIYSTFARKSRRISLKRRFDYVLSVSTPAVSHLVTYDLLKFGHIKAKHWIQIWEDPWYADAYGGNHTRRVFQEEKRLLSFAEKICYVSPLTLEHQKKLFPESADKMYWVPLPSYYQEAQTSIVSPLEDHYGYFGDYVPAARDLRPFYHAALQEDIQVHICGNPCDLFPSTDKIHIHPRLPLSELKKVEEKTNVLVFLCNSHGGQIPGKIYQYSATDKEILFILDGTREEKQVLREYFSQFDRYIFCDNTQEDIRRAIHQIRERADSGTTQRALDCFRPERIVQQVLEMGETR